MDLEQKRVFFGLEVQAPWPKSLPQGRLLNESQRHLTLAFLGKINYNLLKKTLQSIPLPSFKVGFAGKFDQCLFLPLHHPRVVAWHIDFMEEKSPLDAYYEQLIKWLQDKGFKPDTRHSFNPHVTIARAPFNKHAWENAFLPLPCLLNNIHLYESKGQLQYEPVWSFPLESPFEEISHIADVAYWVRGENYDHLYRHAGIALAFSFPEMLPYLEKRDGIHSLDEVIICLNELVAKIDREINCPFKAVSFHSRLEEKNKILHWEMIVDV